MRDPMNPFAAPARRLMIFGHPSHELALFGMLQRYRPHVLVITDGGGEERERQSREGLTGIGLGGQVEYFHYPEASFYQALLDGNVALFAKIAGRLRERIAALEPDQVFCDAIEFYNPVHDVTLPMVRAALAETAEVDLYEVALVYQKPGPGEVYEIQRIPDALADRRITVLLTDQELAAKVHARNHVYLNLREQAGPEFLHLPDEHLRREEMALAHTILPEPGREGRAMRYEWRARKLAREGAIARAITYQEHFLPVVRNLDPLVLT